MWKKIGCNLLYYGVGWTSCERVKDRINEANRGMVSLVSGLSSILMSVMYIITFFVEGIRKNQCVYFVGAISSIVMFWLSITYTKKHQAMILPLAGASCSILYIYGIMIGAITDPTQKTVTFMVVLVFLPILFTVPPITTFMVSYMYVTVFIMLCCTHKSGAVLANDAIDAIIFGILGCASGAVVSKVRIEGYLLEHKLQEISQIDPLTKMRNRYSFELNTDRIPRRCKKKAGCVYIDVNGLHNLNNTKGHQAGDAMLKFIAGQIIETFGEELSFRTGGDEFIVFIIDPDEEETGTKIAEMSQRVEDAGYHIATGLEIQRVGYHSMDNLIKSAEVKMYRSKTKYYEEHHEIRI